MVLSARFGLIAAPLVAALAVVGLVSLEQAQDRAYAADHMLATLDL